MPPYIYSICSICGGNVIELSGAWRSVLPPEPPKCFSCGVEVPSPVPASRGTRMEDDPSCQHDPERRRSESGTRCV